MTIATETVKPQIEHEEHVPTPYAIVFTDAKYVPLKGFRKRTIEYTAILGTNPSERENELIALNGPVSFIRTVGTSDYSRVSRLEDSFRLSRYPEAYGELNMALRFLSSDDKALVDEISTTLFQERNTTVESTVKNPLIEAVVSHFKKLNSEETQKAAFDLARQLINGTVTFHRYRGSYITIYNISDDSKDRLSTAEQSALLLAKYWTRLWIGEPVQSSLIIPTISKEPFPYTNPSQQDLSELARLLRSIQLRDKEKERYVKQLSVLMADLFYDAGGKLDQFSTMIRKRLSPDHIRLVALDDQV